MMMRCVFGSMGRTGKGIARLYLTACAQEYGRNRREASLNGAHVHTIQ
jgi:hypothetical protein